MGTRYLTLRELKRKLSGRSRNSIFADVERGFLPPPFKLGQLNYWVEEDVDAALSALVERTQRGDNHHER